MEVLPGGVQVSLAHPFRDSVDRVIAAAGGGQPSSSGDVQDGRVPVIRFNGFTNRAELLALTTRIKQAQPTLVQGGIKIGDIRPDFMTGTIRAGIDDYSDTTARELARRYGAALAPYPTS